MSGDARIRIEHGHLYDPFFARYPDLYEIATRVAGLALFLRADVYRLWTWLADRARPAPTGAGRRRPHRRVVLPRRRRDAPATRGFDAVLFGHTHNAEHVQMPSGTYVNSGNWLRGHTYVEIDHGKIDLKSWDG